MSEHVSSPFLAYNSTGEVRTLVGNWQEEERLKAVTGCSRTKAVAAQHEAPAEATIFAVRQDAAVHEPTHIRVIEHTEQLMPCEWLTHNRVNYQAPAERTHDLASYPRHKQLGPREEQELKRLLQEAAVGKQPAPAAVNFETTSAANYKQHSLQGLQFGARVMKSQDGGPVQRDPTFLAETQILPRAAADQLMGHVGTSFGSSSDLGFTPNNTSDSCGLEHSCGLKSCIGDAAVPITIYTEAAAKSTFNGHFYGTATINKVAPMNRNDNFTKLMGDINKFTDDQ